LTSPSAGVFDWGHADSLLNVICTRASVRQALSDAAHSATDAFLVYFAGYGLTSDRNEWYLGLSDTDPDALAATGLPVRAIRDLFRESPARHKILILDCTVSGRVMASRAAQIEYLSSRVQDLAAQAAANATYTLVSVSTEVCDGYRIDPGTRLTGALSEMLKNGVSGHPRRRLLSLNVLYRELKRRSVVPGLRFPVQRGTRDTRSLALARNPEVRKPRSYAARGVPSPDRLRSISIPFAHYGALWRPSLRRFLYYKLQQESAEAVAAPLDGVTRAVQAAIRPGLLVFNPPPEMQQGRKERVEVGIARSPELREALTAGLRGRGELQFEPVATSPHMAVELKGPAFEVIPFSPPEQLVAPTARWEFDVLPCHAGRQTLTLCVSLRFDSKGPPLPASGQMAVPVLEREIHIKIAVAYGTRRFIGNNWQWLVATIIPLGGAITAWITLVH